MFLGIFSEVLRGSCLVQPCSRHAWPFGGRVGRTLSPVGGLKVLPTLRFAAVCSLPVGVLFSYYSIIKNLRAQRLIAPAGSPGLRRRSGYGRAGAASNPNILQTPCRRREKIRKKTPPDGNPRPSRYLWPENSFCIPTPRPANLAGAPRQTVILAVGRAGSVILTDSPTRHRPPFVKARNPRD
jgi:hypothetical protein